MASNGDAKPASAGSQQKSFRVSGRLGSIVREQNVTIRQLAQKLGCEYPVAHRLLDASRMTQRPFRPSASGWSSALKKTACRHAGIGDGRRSAGHDRRDRHPSPFDGYAKFT